MMASSTMSPPSARRRPCTAIMIKQDLSKYDLSLRCSTATTAGEALNPEVYNQWLKSRRACKLIEGFGQTETTLYCWPTLTGHAAQARLHGQARSRLITWICCDADGKPVRRRR